MRCFVTGGAGFIGSHLVDRLLQKEHEVVAYDNFSTGRKYFLENALENNRFELIEADLLDAGKLKESMKSSQFIFHMAANADVRFGTEHPRKDLEQNTTATFNVLEAMRENKIKKIVFASTGSIYGEPDVFPTPENAPFPVQTSLYGSSKLACEGLIQAYCEGFDFQGWIFRFVSILGERYTHGHVYDFYKKLQQSSDRLHILGDGHQKKSYLYVQDCLDAIFTAVEKSNEKVNIFNLGTDEYIEINDSVQWVTQELKLSPRLTYSGGRRGWVGDSPFIFLDCTKIRNLGWKPRLTIQEAVLKTLDYLQKNEETFSRR